MVATVTGLLFTLYMCFKDYPSFGQLNYIMQQQRIVPIFALINTRRPDVLNVLQHYEVYIPHFTRRTVT